MAAAGGRKQKSQDNGRGRHDHQQALDHDARGISTANGAGDFRAVGKAPGQRLMGSGSGKSHEEHGRKAAGQERQGARHQGCCQQAHGRQRARGVDQRRKPRHAHPDEGIQQKANQARGCSHGLGKGHRVRRQKGRGALVKKGFHGKKQHVEQRE